MSDKKGTMTNVLNLVDEFGLFIEKTEHLLKTPFESESVKYCVFLDVIKNGKRNKDEIWAKIKAESKAA